jgi:hypothetical protein
MCNIISYTKTQIHTAGKQQNPCAYPTCTQMSCTAYCTTDHKQMHRLHMMLVLALSLCPQQCICLHGLHSCSNTQTPLCNRPELSLRGLRCLVALSFKRDIMAEPDDAHSKEPAGASHIRVSRAFECATPSLSCACV